jgi:hypothetical protein
MQISSKSKLETKSNPVSPKSYKAKKKITYLTKKDSNKNNNKQIQIQKVDLKSNQNNYAILSIPESSNIHFEEKYKSFLCELEMFEWIEYFHYVRTMYVRLDMNNRVYLSYLCRMLGNNITLYSDIFIENYELTYKYSENRIINRPIYFKSYRPDEIRSEPIYIYEFYDDGYKYNFFYSESILKSNTRYALITVTIKYIDTGHYCFLFIDHEKKIVEFYDPDIGSKEVFEFIYSSLVLLFVDYKVEDFSKLKGIQHVETMEESNEEGFCVVWANMMIHMKLLNINTPIHEIEELFILECFEKNLPLYEVMLNYSYFMTRVISKKINPFVKLKNLLI